MNITPKCVGLLNFHWSRNNYGAVLQAAALANEIDELGFVPCHIKLVPEVSKRTRNLKYRIKRCVVFLGKFILRKEALWDESASIFDHFRHSFISETDTEFNSLEDLKCASLDFDYYLVGSDQIWRPKYTDDLALAYFFDFVSNAAPRISYAASFGIDTWEDCVSPELTSQIKDNIKKFKAVSVREASGVAICNEIFNVDASHVLDPTLLVGRKFFEKVIESEAITQSLDASKIVYYKLDIDDDFQELLNHVSNELGAEPENLYYGRKKVLGKIVLFYNSIPTWLRKIRDSEIVITDSFHCLCFALLFERKFIYYPNSRGLARIESLLGMLGLKERIYKTSDDVKSRGSWNKNISFTNVKEILQQKRIQSKAFLLNAFKVSDND